MVHGGKSFRERLPPALSSRMSAVCHERKIVIQRIQREMKDLHRKALHVEDMLVPVGCVKTVWKCGKRDQGRPVKYFDGDSFRHGVLDSVNKRTITEKVGDGHFFFTIALIRLQDGTLCGVPASHTWIETKSSPGSIESGAVNLSSRVYSLQPADKVCVKHTCFIFAFYLSVSEMGGKRKETLLKRCCRGCTPPFPT